MEKRGVMPGPWVLGAQLVVQSALAAHFAHRWAAQGYHPVEAARHGDRSARWIALYCVGPVPCVALGGLALLVIPGVFSLLWWCVLTCMTVVLGQRLKTYVQTPPGYRLNYLMPTGGLCALFLVWMICWVIFASIDISIMDAVSPSSGVYP